MSHCDIMCCTYWWHIHDFQSAFGRHRCQRALSTIELALLKELKDAEGPP